MSDVESLIPFLQQLVQRLRITPPANEMALLQKATFKEMRPYFDALTAGRPDTELYQMILKYLANPNNGTGLSGDAPASPPKAAAAPQAPAPTPSAAPAPPQDSKRQIRKLMDGVELHVIEESGPKWVFELATKGTNDLSTITLDFSASMNISLKPEGPSKSTGPLSFSVNAPTIANTGGKELRAVIATASGTGNNVSLNYKAGIRSGGAAPASSQAPANPPQDDSAEPDEVTSVADGLSVIVQSVETGYTLHGSNTHSSQTYSTTIDLGESTNLTFSAIAPATMDGPNKVTFTLGPNAGKVAIVNCSVKDYAVGSCDIRYKVSARVA
jgi:hypothetical protein